MLNVVSFCLFFVFYYGNILDDLHVSKECVENFCVPRIIWSQWNADDMLPEDVEDMVNITKRSLANFKYCFLTPKNLSNFLDVSIFPNGYSQVHVQGQSDYIRLCLLEKYGGVYVDATTYVTSGDGMEWMFAEAMKAKRSVFGFQKINAKFLLELNIYGASENSMFMKKYKEEYDKALSSVDIKQYVLDICEELRKHGYAHVSECKRRYFLVDHVFIKTAYNNDTLMADVLMLPAGRNQHRLGRECDWNEDCFWDRLLHDPVARSYPFTKVTRKQRPGKLIHLGDAEYESKFVWKKDYNPHNYKKKEKKKKSDHELVDL